MDEESIAEAAFRVHRWTIAAFVLVTLSVGFLWGRSLFFVDVGTLGISDGPTVGITSANGRTSVFLTHDETIVSQSKSRAWVTRPYRNEYDGERRLFARLGWHFDGKVFSLTVPYWFLLLLAFSIVSAFLFGPGIKKRFLARRFS